jgi:putative IMPACT (imprinted ancient) family translation regulator
LVRAYTDVIAQALLVAQKIPLQKLQTLGCRIPYPLEGALRRELASSGATLIGVDHQHLVELRFELPESDVAALKLRVDEIGQGRIDWFPAT